MYMKIYCFGNLDIKEDKVALELADELNDDTELTLKGFEFVKTTNPDFFLNENYLDTKIIIIDVVKGIENIKIINDLDELKTTKTTTMHDFDLGNTLKLLKELGKIKEVIIIGIPHGKELTIMDKENVKMLISNM
jgi:Ni,Fe-hydrogenase maturation factor